tara:strand:- start:1209 stop:2654 length:1446 start_codon:yes stop_codon:yes gene_type:complete
MDKVNLDINTYTLTELENLLKLQKPYNQQDIENKKKKLEKTINISNINQNKKEELYIFLDNIKNKLTSEYLNSIRPSEKTFNDINKYDGNHFVIKNDNNNYTSLLENNKKVNKSVIKKTFTIDSIFRSNYDNLDNQSHDYIVELPETITNAVTMSISSIELPLSYHNISEELNNNIFNISVKKYNVNNSTGIEYDNPDLNVDFSYNITLIPGIYESRFTSSAQVVAADIVLEINNQIAAQVAPPPSPHVPTAQEIIIASDICSNLTFEVSRQSGFGAFKYSNNTATGGVKLENGYEITINFNIDNNSIRNFCSDNLLYQKLGWQLGFRSQEITFGDNSVTTLIGGAGSPVTINSVTGTPEPHTMSILSPGICHISYPRYLYIGLDDYQTSSRNYFAVASSSTIAPNIVARVNILSCLEDKTAFKNGGAPGDYLYTLKHIREYFGPTNIKKIRVQILDEYGRNFSLNNMDWSFVASWECFYN